MRTAFQRLSFRRPSNGAPLSPTQSPTSPKASLDTWPKKGDYVMAKLDIWKRYYRGKIKSHDKAADTFDILFDDGDRQKAVPRRCICRPEDLNDGAGVDGSGLGSPASSPQLGTASLWPNQDDIVAVKLDDWPAYYRGRVKAVGKLNTFDVLFDDGERHKAVPKRCILRPEEVEGGLSSTPRPEKPHQRPSDLKWPMKGDYVMAKLDDWSRYYGGEVKKVSKTGDSFELLFDDGERQKNVPRRCICRPGEVPNVTPSSSESTYEMPLQPVSRFMVGDRVSCRIAGWNTWYDGYVTQVNLDLTYVVQFDDGEVVSTVREKEMMPVQVDEKDGDAPPLPPTGPPVLQDFVQLNGRVEAMCDGWHKYYLGTVKEIREDRRSCTVLFDDGELKEGVKPHELRLARTRSQMRITFDLSETVKEDSVLDFSGKRKKPLKIGMRVMANPFSEWTKAYPGKIEHRMNDGTFAILFDDGERVAGVGADDIDPMPNNQPSEGPSMEETDEIEWNIGQAVEARVSGWRKYYPGKIRRENPDGTFVVDFLDGEVVHQVKREEMRKARQRAETTASEVTERPNSPDQVFELGERVAAKLFVNEKWRKYWGGEVLRCNEDGSYKIAFDDGEVYSQVWPVEMKRPKPGSALAAPILKPPPPEFFEVGERVEAKTMNWQSWYAGLVERRNSDNTYIVQFDDGERLLDVKLGEIRRLIKAKTREEDSDDEDDDDER